MSETAEEKTKREFLKLFEKYEWNNQITVFFNDYDQRFNFLEYSQKIRRHLTRYRPEVGFLWRHLLSPIRNIDLDTTIIDEMFYNFPDDNPNGVVMPCITFFTYQRLSKEEFQDFIEELLDSRSVGGVSVWLKRKSVSYEERVRYAARIRRQKPHNFKKYFGLDVNPKRYGVINKSKLVTWADVFKKRPPKTA